MKAAFIALWCSAMPNRHSSLSFKAHQRPTIFRTAIPNVSGEFSSFISPIENEISYNLLMKGNSLKISLGFSENCHRSLNVFVLLQLY